jgi:hypothetical protein
VQKIAGNGTGDTRWKIPGVLDWSTGVYNPCVDITKSTTTLYASDRDVFLFLVDDLIRAVRENVPELHRWVGRIYVFAAFVSGLGGLAFILEQGTIGGLPMDAGFGLYGVLVVLASVATFWYAIKREIPTHRAWAIRLFALVIGS